MFDAHSHKYLRTPFRTLTHTHNSLSLSVNVANCCVFIHKTCGTLTPAPLPFHARRSDFSFFCAKINVTITVGSVRFRTFISVVAFKAVCSAVLFCFDWQREAINPMPTKLGLARFFVIQG